MNRSSRVPLLTKEGSGEVSKRRVSNLPLVRIQNRNSFRKAIRTTHGFTLIELMIAVVLLSTAALALERTLVSTRQALAVSGKWARAAQLAAEAMEQVRAGQAPGPVREAAEFARTVAVTPWSGHVGLQRIEVTVTWNDGESHSFGLVTLARG